jgi:ABC-2 type transport system permease protein
MNAYLTLVRRELGSYFVSLTGYIIIALVTLLLGISFTALVEALSAEPADMPITDLFYSTFYFWIILLIAVPVVTMRSFAQEKYSGTYETLMTTPVSELAVVLAKFSSTLIFYILLWLPLLAYIFVLRHYTNEASALDLGPVGTTFLGILLLGSVYMSAGCFASALTRSQIVAAMLSFTLGMGLLLLSFLSLGLPPQSGWVAKALQQVSMIEHMQEFVRGIVDTRYLVFYVSLTVFFLFLTLKVVEARRWK